MTKVNFDSKVNPLIIHKVGNYYQYDGNGSYYQIVRTELYPLLVALLILESGEICVESVCVKNPFDITNDEFTKFAFAPSSRFRLVKSITITENE